MTLLEDIYLKKNIPKIIGKHYVAQLCAFSDQWSIHIYRLSARQTHTVGATTFNTRVASHQRFELLFVDFSLQTFEDILSYLPDRVCKHLRSILRLLIEGNY